ncbi:hypothetical protein DAPPUDRAFT_112346 [Daphnia pulex]|uniref:Uncharacterized protein n=1 Tax=Daphnia pulex TaxID=6669 RepID=E9HBR9_DAPPU|nr:hypothetical protein DAPPUDRAFT_112346 [Daphnia pulex]|eukprot:EFX70824.1 hypothetical protein DAPPUDRAFT_112346 [Daphnia pulex]
MKMKMLLKALTIKSFNTSIRTHHLDLKIWLQSSHSLYSCLTIAFDVQKSDLKRISAESFGREKRITRNEVFLKNTRKLYKGGLIPNEAEAIVVLEEEDGTGVKEEDIVGSVNEVDVTVGVVKEEEVAVAKWRPSVTLPHELKDTISIWVD